MADKLKLTRLTGRNEGKSSVLLFEFESDLRKAKIEFPVRLDKPVEQVAERIHEIAREMLRKPTREWESS